VSSPVPEPDDPSPIDPVGDLPIDPTTDPPIDPVTTDQGGRVAQAAKAQYRLARGRPSASLGGYNDALR
jgi:hypothetical protein